MSVLTLANIIGIVSLLANTFVVSELIIFSFVFCPLELSCLVKTKNNGRLWSDLSVVLSSVNVKALDGLSWYKFKMQKIID